MNPRRAAAGASGHATAVLLAGAAGAFDVAGEPVLSPGLVARLLGGRYLPVSRSMPRGLLGATRGL
ncbi:hypothetical protein [Actinoplanes siamensis]|uniref:Uncharacterized protein n=1 Tax=Actinoplanes siamensis TaxID=1223317 RepID=A0A919N5Y2_9ACTN|nr:hypothetical protein [Actinoplanes siamensis]GIF04936.1 hypothetical protein Asi03nite_24740 [Actinoplanes siamensis]